MHQLGQSNNRNVSYLQYIAVCRNSYFLLPFFVAYCLFIGLSLFDVFFLQAVFALGVILCEVPAGVFSDCFGRRRAISCGCIFGWLASTVFLIGRSLPVLSIAELLMALSIAMFSGSDTALLYESTDQRQYPEQESKLQAYSRYAEGLSSVIAAVLSAFSLFLLPIMDGLIRALSCYCSFSLCDVRSSVGSVSSRGQLKSVWVKQWNTFIQKWNDSSSPLTHAILFFSAGISVITLSMFWLLQLWLQQHHVSPIAMGFVWLCYHTCSGCAAYLVKPMMRHCGIKLGFYSLFIGCCFIVMTGCLTESGLLLGVFFIAALVFGFKMPWIYIVLNRNIAADARASFLSLDSCYTRIGFAITALLMAGVAQIDTLQRLFAVMLLVLILTGLALWRLSYLIGRGDSEVVL